MGRGNSRAGGGARLSLCARLEAPHDVQLAPQRGQRALVLPLQRLCPRPGVERRGPGVRDAACPLSTG